MNRELVDRDSEQVGVRFDYSQLLLKNASGPLAKTDGAPMEAKRKNRSEEAKHWNPLTSWRPEHLSYAL